MIKAGFLNKELHFSFDTDGKVFISSPSGLRWLADEKTLKDILFKDLAEHPEHTDYP